MKPSIIALLFVAACNLAGAAENSSPTATSTSTSASQPEPARQAVQIGNPVQSDGNVISIRSLKLAGIGEDHTLVKLEKANGELSVVDLGSTADLKKNGLVPRENQKLFVDGRMGK